MNKKIVIGVVVALVAVVGLSFLLKDNKEPVQENKEIETVSVIYSNGETELVGIYDNTNETVSFYHETLGDNTLERVISASGDRYANADESLVFWEHQGELTITKDGEEAFVGRIVETPDYSNLSLIGTWNFDKVVTEDDEFVMKKKEEFTITFNDDGKVNGTTDCNGFFGSYEVEEDGSLEFSPLGSTMMYCEDSQESEFMAYLSLSESYSFSSPEELVIKLESGHTLNFSK